MGCQHIVKSLQPQHLLSLKLCALIIPSEYVLTTIEQCENLFKLYICQQGITNTKNLKKQDGLGNQPLLPYLHDDGSNESIIGDDHQIKFIKWIADIYFMMCLFTHSKHYTETIIQNEMPSNRHQSNKLILFKNI